MARMAWVEQSVVMNLIEIRPEQVPEFQGPGISIVALDDLDVRLGDGYQEGAFYRDGELLSLGEEGGKPDEALPEDVEAALELMGVQVYEEA